MLSCTLVQATKMAVLRILQVVNLQEEGKMKVSTTSTGYTAVVPSITSNVLTYIQRLTTIAGNESAQCVSREEFEHTRVEMETLKHELNSWQNTTISILKQYLLNQGTFAISTDRQTDSRVHMSEQKLHNETLHTLFSISHIVLWLTKPNQ